MTSLLHSSWERVHRFPYNKKKKKTKENFFTVLPGQRSRLSERTQPWPSLRKNHWVRVLLLPVGSAARARKPVREASGEVLLMLLLWFGLVGEMELEQKLSDALVPHQCLCVQTVNTRNNFFCSGRVLLFSLCKRLYASLLPVPGR